MRVSLVVHGFPPREVTGVENYTAALASALARAGHVVEVFTLRREPSLAHLSVRREETPEGFGLTWLTVNEDPRDPEQMLAPPGAARAFGEFLDRERPQVVHFQHLIKLGLDLVAEASQREIPTLYTAHDYYPVCHRYTLLRPDLERCETLADPATCARCDLALSVLNRCEELGDYQAGVRPADLPEDLAQELVAVLEGRAEATGFGPAEWDAAIELRQKLDQRRARSYARLDLVLAPTRFLAAALERGGLNPERIRHLPYGIRTESLASVAPVALEPGEPLRFGYLGGLSKQKGVEVLIEAFARLGEPAELVIRGDTGDTLHLERLRRAATEAGARWGGPYLQAELPACLAEIDVLVVPSVWVENQPFVIREAFAAGRPVLASHLGALPESVADGVDGLLFAPGDAAALAAVMERCLREDGLVEQLAAGIRPVLTLDEQVAQLSEIYGGLIASAARDPRAGLPNSLGSFSQRLADLQALPMRQLFGHVLDGLEGLRSGLGASAEDLPVADLLRESLSVGSHIQILLRDRSNELVWLHHVLEGREEETGVLRQRLDWTEQVLADRERAVGSLGSEVEDRERRIEALSRELDWLKESVRTRDEELGWLKDSVGGKDEELEWLKQSLAAVEQEREWLHGIVADQETRLTEAAEREQLQEAEHEEDRERFLQRLRQAAQVAMSALDSQGQLVAQELAPLATILASISDLPRPGGREADLEREVDATLQSIARAIRASVDHARAIQAELDWRRDQMGAAAAEARRKVVHLLIARTGLGNRIAAWAGGAELASERELSRAPENPESEVEP